LVTHLREWVGAHVAEHVMGVVHRSTSQYAESFGERGGGVFVIVVEVAAGKNSRKGARKIFGGADCANLRVLQPKGERVNPKLLHRGSGHAGWSFPRLHRRGKHDTQLKKTEHIKWVETGRVTMLCNSSEGDVDCDKTAKSQEKSGGSGCSKLRIQWEANDERGVLTLEKKSGIYCAILEICWEALLGGELWVSK